MTTREQFAERLVSARQRVGISTLTLVLPPELVYIFNKDQLVGGWSVERGPYEVYLGNAWSDEPMGLYKYAYRWFKENTGNKYVIHSHKLVKPLWSRIGFVETGKTVTHPEVLLNNQPLKTWEMIKLT